MGQMSAIDEFLTAIENATIPGCDAWSADATLDATVPNWRMHKAGAGRDPRRVRAAGSPTPRIRRAAPAPGAPGSAS